MITHDTLNSYAVNPLIEIPRYLKVKKSGGFYVLKCPFHKGIPGEKDSFTVNLQNKSYYCVSCAKKGTADELLEELIKRREERLVCPDCKKSKKLNKKSNFCDVP